MYRIFLVEDDRALADALATSLSSWGYEVVAAKDFSHITEEFVRSEAHLVILDLMLPSFNGYHWCREIRQHSQVPVVFLSSAADNMNIVLAMNMGADDFIAKPVDSTVLAAKLGALLRRAYDLGDRAVLLEHDGLVLNLDDQSASCGGERVVLSRNEFRILETLLRAKGKVVSRDTLMTRLWEGGDYIEENTLTVNVTRLRKKLESIGAKDLIRTRVGLGYEIARDSHA